MILIDEGLPDFAGEMREKTGVDFNLCLQCKTCATG